MAGVHFFIVLMERSVLHYNFDGSFFFIIRNRPVIIGLKKGKKV